MPDHGHRQSQPAYQRHQSQQGDDRDRPGQVLPDHRVGPPTEAERHRDTIQFFTGEDYVAGLQGDIGAGHPHRHPEVGGGDRRSVVDAVTDHGNRPVAVAQFGHDLELLIREQTGVELVDSGLGGNRAHHFQGITADYHRMDPESAELAHRVGRAGADAIRQSHHPYRTTAITADHQGRVAGRLQVGKIIFRDCRSIHPVGHVLADPDAFASDIGGDAPARVGLETERRLQREPAIGHLHHHRPGERVLGVLLDRRGQTEHRVLRITAKGTDRDHDRPADGQRAGLVEGHDLDGAGCLQAITALEHDAAAGPAGDGRQNRRRDRNHHRAGRRDHENRHRTVDGLAPFEIKPQAGDEQHEDRHPDHHHGIDRTDPLGHALGARARFFRLFDHPHDLRQRAVSGACGGLHPQDAELIQSRGVDRDADELVHRDRLAGHRGFVHRRLPGHDRTIHRNPISRPHYDHVAGREIFNRNFDRLLLARHPGHLRAQFHQRLNRPPGPGHGVVFKGGAEREQKH